MLDSISLDLSAAIYVLFRCHEQLSEPIVNISVKDEKGVSLLASLGLVTAGPQAGVMIPVQLTDRGIAHAQSMADIYQRARVDLALSIRAMKVAASEKAKIAQPAQAAKPSGDPRFCPPGSDGK